MKPRRGWKQRNMKPCYYHWFGVCWKATIWSLFCCFCLGVFSKWSVAMCTRIIVTSQSFTYRLFACNLFTQDFTQEYQICIISTNLRLSQSFWWLFHLWQRRHFPMSVIAVREATTNNWNINKITQTFGDRDEVDCFHLISGKQFGRGGAGVAEGGSIKCHRTSCLCQQGHLHPRPPLQPDKVADPWSSFQNDFHVTFLTGEECVPSVLVQRWHLPWLGWISEYRNIKFHLS